MEVEILTLGPFATNCHIVPRPGGKALVIDVCAEPDRIIRHLEARKLTPVAYLITHGHMDHVSALADVSDRFPAPIGIHPRETDWAFTPVNSAPGYYDTPRAPARLDRSWADGQKWTDAGLEYEILDTPGHSPGSVSFYFRSEGAIFCGDVLFQGSVGRTDLPGGDPRLLARSLARLKELSDETVVYPGHGPSTTIGREKRTNIFMRGGL